MARSALFVNKQSGGMFSIEDMHRSTGSRFYVHSGTGIDAAGYGRNPDAPCATIDYAVSLCAADKGDIIYVMPGHTETVSAAAGIDLDVTGISVIGLGQGNLRPTVTFGTATTADLDVDAANVTVRNIRFVGNIASLAAPIDVNAAGFSLLDCDFYCNAAGTGILITIITDATANELTVKGCNFYYLTSLATTAVTETSTEVIRLVGADRAIIVDNYFGGDFTTTVVNGITTASKEVQIARNHIHNIATEDIAGVVDLVAACTGVIANNVGFMGYATSLAGIIDPASCAMVENYFSNVVTEAGGLVGTAST